MKTLSKSKFKSLYLKMNLSHHPFNRMSKYLEWCFKDVVFENKNVLDIGGGNGIFSFYAKFKGANKVINLEPFADGSTLFDFDGKDIDHEFRIILKNNTLQEYETKEKFNIIILHDSINHLDEGVFEKIHKSEKAMKEYKVLTKKIISHLNPGGQIIITDCSRRNFWGDLGMKSPFAPAIDWHLHQKPSLIKILFKDYKFNFRLRWTPFKRFGKFGYALSLIGFLPSYFMQSHFNLFLEDES
jgi:SAM-dependent methyltransferase